jgi:ribosomal protein S18 acetylase RimI-like enzyme
MRVERAEPRDLDEIAPLFDAYRSFYGQPPDLERARGFLAERLAAQDSAVFVARDEARAIGFVQLYPLHSSLQTARSFVLNDLFVLPGERGRGAATRLIERAAAYAVGEGAVGIELETAADNQAARAVYERLGWRLDETFVRYALPLRDAP